MQSISIIIPVLNDKKPLQDLLRHLALAPMRELFEILVVDGGSTDGVKDVIPPSVKLIQTDKACRAAQMNAGARAATGEVFYFVHADCLPPLTLVADINNALGAGNLVGCYQLKLTPGTWLLQLNSYFSRFRTAFSGGGDQTLYVPRKIFEEAGGFNDAYCVMEDFELVHRLIPFHGYYILPKDVLVSSRKYRHNSYFRVNLANYLSFMLYRKKVKPQVIREYYYSLLKEVK